ncbi:rho guanine nucleotide exchange factor 38 [Accipiter gentilis]|uniref:rho guanine nucleotide exchange factor 38 n=1 Tax=Astur gentilis TaxID=8957 RepID=UPI00210F4C22|nr:rho guanine nucleotide exchange factor 38 [Accipiter gentilis]
MRLRFGVPAATALRRGEEQQHTLKRGKRLGTAAGPRCHRRPQARLATASMDCPGKEGAGGRRRNLALLRNKLYMGERRRTEPVVESTAAAGDHGTLRRSQSDRTEYSQKLQEKMAPQAGSSTPATSPQEDEEQVSRRMMAKRVKIIAELVQTEKDYIGDLDLCIKEVIQPLRKKQIARFDVDGLFSNIELVHQVSAKLLSLLEEATTDVEPPMQIIGEVFLQIKGPLEDTYKIYCYRHDDAHTMLESYEKDEELKQHLRHCVQSLKKIYEEEGKPNLMDMGSLMIKPVQRVMKYPLLLCELLNSTPASHPDHKALQDALFAMKNINVNINELKRRKDLVLKYKRNDDDETLKEKFSRLNIHSISKKSKRVTSHLKILTGGEPQVKDQTFNKEEKLFRSLEKTVKLCVKNTSLSSQHLQDSIHLAAQNIIGLQEILQDKDDGVNNCLKKQNTANLCEDLMAQLDKLVLAPLSALQALFLGPQKLIQKRYDKLLDYNSYLQKSTGEELDLAKKDYEALNAQLVEELQVFNRAAKKIVLNCLHCFITLLRNIMSAALQSNSAVVVPVPLSSSSICEVQNQLMEEVHKLNFVKENSSATFIERKLSLEKKKPVPSPLEPPRQTEGHRSKLLSTYSTELLYQAKRKCNATQEFDIDLHEGELVAVVEQKDPFGSTSRWLVDAGILKGYVYSSFLRPYNPAKAQKDVAENGFGDDDFDNISLFVSSRPSTDSSTRSPGHKKSDSSSSLHFCENPTVNGTVTDAFQDMDDQHTFYAVYAFQARNDQELSLQEYQKVRILRFSDLSGNKEWWLAEAKGQKGYVPSNYLGKMTYA